MAERDVIAESKERFDNEVERHELSVLRDDDLYRHLRFRRPDTITYWFDILTWPGYLAVVGDCGDFVFARTRDMMDFFAADHGRINPQYWSEKLRAPRPDAALTFSHDKLVIALKEWFKEQDYDMSGNLLGATGRQALWEAIDRQIINVSWSEAEAVQHLRDFQHKGHLYLIDSAWEWNLREYDWSFLWCCWAIVWGIRVYREQDKDYLARRDVREYLLTRPEFTGRSAA